MNHANSASEVLVTTSEDDPDSTSDGSVVMRPFTYVDAGNDNVSKSRLNTTRDGNGSSSASPNGWPRYPFADGNVDAAPLALTANSSNHSAGVVLSTRSYSK